MPLEDKVEQLQRLKAKRSRERELRDLEERVLLDNLEDTNRKLRGSPPPQRARPQLLLSKNKSIRGMQIKYERERERDLYGHPRRNYKKADQPRYNPQADPKVKQLAETHGRQMEYLSNRNRDLERQREEIRRRLEDLGRRPIKEDDGTSALLQELRDQEARNQRLLEELRRQLMDVRYAPPLGEPPKKGSSYLYPIYFGNSLVAEIAAVRQAYLQNGGNDPGVLQQLAQMQAEAQAIDDSLQNRPIKVKEKRDPDSFLTLELENERLQRQLLLLQEQNMMAKQRRKDDREGRKDAGGTSLHPRHRGRAVTTYTQVPALDIQQGARADNPGVTVNQFRRPPPRRFYTAEFDPLKAKIDRDLENVYGYRPHLKERDESKNQAITQEAVVMNKAYVGVRTLLPEEVKDHVFGPAKRPRNYPIEDDKQSNFVQNQQRNQFRQNEKLGSISYYKNHMLSRKLNQIEQDLRASYNLNSQPHIQGGNMALTGQGQPGPHYETRTQFEAEFFNDTARSDGHSIPGHPPHSSRPQLLVEGNPID